MTGAADVLLEIVVPDLRCIQDLLLETLLQRPAVTDVRSNITVTGGLASRRGQVTPRKIVTAASATEAASPSMIAAA